MGPYCGRQFTLPLGKGFSLNLRGDIGGFGVGSDLAWQVYPYLDWQFAKWASLQPVRWLDMDYETGSGASRFKYDMLNQGAQIGFTFHFYRRRTTTKACTKKANKKEHTNIDKEST